MIFSKKKTALGFSAILLAGILMLTGCAEPDSQQTQNNTDSTQTVSHISKEDLSGKTGGVLSGTPQDKTILSKVDESNVMYFDTIPDEAIALSTNKVDFFICADQLFRFIQPAYPGLAESDFVFDTYKAGVIFPMSDKGRLLQNQMNDYIDKLNDSGEAKELEDYWLSPGEKKGLDMPASGRNGVLSAGTNTSIPPYSYTIGEKSAGYDMALLKGFCEEYGYGIKIDDSHYAGIVTGTATGKYDICAGIIPWTQERSEKVLYSQPYLKYDMVAIVKTEERPADSGIFDELKTGFYRTFIEENRWETIVDGLGTTLIISLFGFILANILGALFCSMALSHRKGLRTTAEVYSRIMQGTPIVVIILILYYLVFGNSNISGILISIIAFGISTGAYLAQLFTSNISRVERGQTEAALALGMTGFEAFSGIVLPQAIRNMLPEYFGQMIGMLKGTSIVGYIAVIDLTKAGDNIRGATFDAFFPLITCALIYFILANLLLFIMTKIQKRLAPKRRNAPKKDGE